MVLGYHDLAGFPFTLRGVSRTGDVARLVETVDASNPKLKLTERAIKRFLGIKKNDLANFSQLSNASVLTTITLYTNTR